MASTFGPVTTLAGVKMPRLIYGTAWKKETTADLVYMAIKNGFRGVDTACQPKHYREDLVGEGIQRAIREGVITRSDLFVQTKFTPLSGQDPKQVPYNPHHDFESQVRESVGVSLKNLQVDYIDSLLIHSPLRTHRDTMHVYHTLEGYAQQGVIKQLGISNCYDPQEFNELNFQLLAVIPSFIVLGWLAHVWQNFLDRRRGLSVSRIGDALRPALADIERHITMSLETASPVTAGGLDTETETVSPDREIEKNFAHGDLLLKIQRVKSMVRNAVPERDGMRVSFLEDLADLERADATQWQKVFTVQRMFRRYAFLQRF
eukprot:GDKI01005194.1.p1 GENE.GDKI01005194.1~~GDKI01005194.1.p1  ORF type:complete len:355 (-),score=72.29 GDKI01005194.1:110-1063(-)